LLVVFFTFPESISTIAIAPSLLFLFQGN
jgi:hypothetical protein